jgi:hypothetical protein
VTKLMQADEARIATKKSIEDNTNSTLEALNGRIQNAIRNGNYYLVTDLGLSNDVIIRLLENGYIITNESNLFDGCKTRISWERNPDCNGLGYDSCEWCDYPCPYR